MEEDSKLENILRNLSLFVGVVLLIGSIYLSYDGFDQKVSGGNSEYTILAVIIGVSLAIAVSLLEFITASRLEGLNTTLKIIGVLAYAYSIWTNYLGAKDLLHMDMGMAAITALFMDIVPEPMIAWGLGEAVMHDLFKNLGSIATSSPSKKKGKGGGGQQQQQSQPRHQQGQQGQQGQQSQHGHQQTRPQQQFGQNQRGRPEQMTSDARYSSVIEKLRKDGKIQ